MDNTLPTLSDFDRGLLKIKNASFSNNKQQNNNNTVHRSSAMALHYLRKDKAHLARLGANVTVIPIPKAQIEKQRKTLVNQRYSDLMHRVRGSEDGNNMNEYHGTGTSNNSLQFNRSRTRFTGSRGFGSSERNSNNARHDRSSSASISIPGFRYHSDGAERRIPKSLLQHSIMTKASGVATSAIKKENRSAFTSAVDYTSRSTNIKRKSLRKMASSVFSFKRRSSLDHDHHHHHHHQDQNSPAIPKRESVALVELAESYMFEDDLSNAPDAIRGHGSYSTYSNRHGMSIDLLEERTKLLAEAREEEAARTRRATEQLLNLKKLIVKSIEGNRANPTTDLQKLQSQKHNSFLSSIAATASSGVGF